MSNQTGRNPSGSLPILLLLLLAGVAVLMTVPASAAEGVTIAAYGDQSYYYGEEVILHGNNSVSDTVYLSITGPNLPVGGAQLTLPHTASVSGDPGTFTVVKTRPDRSWEYAFYTANIRLDAGSFTITAADRPAAGNLTADTAAGRMKIILKRPFIMAELAPATIRNGQSFVVNGTAEGDPPSVQLWFIGDNFVYNTTAPVNPDASFTFRGDTPLAGSFPEGQGYLIVQHSMQNNAFDAVVSGDSVLSPQAAVGRTLFRIRGPGSLQGRDAAEALMAALGDPEIGDDTYTVLPFMVESAKPPITPAGGTTAGAMTASPAPDPAQPPLVPFALFGAFVLVLGIVVWKRR